MKRTILMTILAASLALGSAADQKKIDANVDKVMGK
jgi:hypothetical protein